MKGEDGEVDDNWPCNEAQGSRQEVMLQLGLREGVEYESHDTV